MATQNLEAFYKRVPNGSDVRNFLGNVGLKIMLRNEDAESNKWASALFGFRTDIVVTISEQAAGDTGWFRRRHTSYGRSSRSVPRVPPESFVHLAVPVRDDPGKHFADSILHVGSREAVELVRLTWPVNPLR